MVAGLSLVQSIRAGSLKPRRTLSYSTEKQRTLWIVESTTSLRQSENRFSFNRRKIVFDGDITSVVSILTNCRHFFHSSYFFSFISSFPMEFNSSLLHIESIITELKNSVRGYHQYLLFKRTLCVQSGPKILDHLKTRIKTKRFDGFWTAFPQSKVEERSFDSYFEDPEYFCFSKASIPATEENI